MGWFKRNPKSASKTPETRLADLARLVAECPPYDLRALAAAVDIEWNLFLTLFGSVASFDETPHEQQLEQLRKRLAWQADLKAGRDQAEACACELVNLYMSAAIASDRPNREAAAAVIFHLLQTNRAKEKPNS